MPERRQTKTLGELCSFDYGASLPSQVREEGDVAVVGSAGQIGWHSVPLISGPGIVIGRKGTVGHATWVPGDFWPIDTTYFVRPRDGVDLRWLFFLLDWFPLKSLDSATGVPGLNRNDAYRLSVRYFPEETETQKLIADILDAIDDAILETDAVIAKHEALRLGLLDDLISIPAQVGQAEAPDTLADLVASISSGCSVNADDHPPTAGEFGVLKTSAVGDGRFRPLESKAVWPREINRLKCPVVASLILFSRMNTPQLVGENAFVDQDHPGLFLPDRLWAIRVKEDEGVVPEWIATVLQSRQARAFITGEATGTSGSMKNIAQTSLLRLPISSALL